MGYAKTEIIADEAKNLVVPLAFEQIWIKYTKLEFENIMSIVQFSICRSLKLIN